MELLRVNTAQKWKLLALEWIFGGETQDGVLFQDVCHALGARDWVVQLRLQLEFWRKEIAFKHPLSRFYQPPDRLVEDAYHRAQKDGVTLIHAIWCWPGMPFRQVCALFDSAELVLDDLETRGLLVSSYNRELWYCVGNSPNSPLNRYGKPKATSWAAFWRE